MNNAPLLTWLNAESPPPLPTWVVPVREVVISDQTAKWCELPYPGHPKGCPNVGKAAHCPPQAPKLGEVFDLGGPLYLVHSDFDLDAHAAKMRSEHPEWTERQCRCLLYWQPRSRKQMRQRVEEAMPMVGADVSAACPEAMGLNVFATARKSGLILDKTRTISTARHITLIGRKAR